MLFKKNKKICRKRVMLVTRSAVTGGVEEHVFQLSKFLLSKDYDVIWVVLSSDNLNKKYQNIDGLVFIMLDDKSSQSVSSFFLITKIFKLVWKYRPDIVHLHGIRPMLLFSLFPFPTSVCRISTIHGSYLLMAMNQSGDIVVWKRYLSALFHLFACWRSNKVITVSIFTFKEIESLASPFFFKNMEVIYNWVNLSSFSKNLAPENLTKTFLPNEMQVVFVGRIDPHKGIDLIIRAAAEINSSIPIRYHFFGNGYMRYELESLAKTLSISDRIHFWGDIENIREFLSVFHVLVLPSYSEGMPLTLLEAMAAGIPVIGTTVGGIPEVIVDGETGYLIPPGDFNAIAHHLKHLSMYPDLRLKFGYKGRERAKALFNKTIQLKKIVEMYDLKD